MQGELLSLMKEFEVCYEIAGRRGHYIAPHLLELNPPGYNPETDWDSHSNLIVTYRYVFKPKNIFPRLIVALHELIENQTIVWKHGVVLVSTTSSGNTRVEITEDDTYKNANIRIRISGADKKRMLSVAGHELDRINNTFDNIEHVILIPCNCSECKGSQTPHEFPYKDLCRSLSKRNYTLKCLRSFEEVNVQTLINDVADPRAYREQAAADIESSNRSPFSEKAVNINIYQEQQYQEPINVTVSGDAKDTQIIAGKNNTAAQTTEINQHGKGDNVAGNKIEGDSINTQINEQDLTQLSDILKALLEDLSEEYNATTAKGQANIQRDALETIRQDPTLQQRLTNALKAGSEEALAQMIQHPLAKIIVKAIKGLIEV